MSLPVFLSSSFIANDQSTDPPLSNIRVAGDIQRLMSEETGEAVFIRAWIAGICMYVCMFVGVKVECISEYIIYVCMWYCTCMCVSTQHAIPVHVHYNRIARTHCLPTCLRVGEAKHMIVA